MNIPRCDYCQKQSERVTGKEIYPHRKDLFEKTFYRCVPCSAYVGCHPGTQRALGRLANSALRAAKQKAHAAFDPLWKTGGLRRGYAYMLLAKALGMSKKDCHIGMFSEEQCIRVIEICQEMSVNNE